MRPLSLVLWFYFSTFAFGAESSLKDYLQKALPPLTVPTLENDSSAPLFRDVELRVGADDEDFKSARLRFSPYGWSESTHLKDLTRKEQEHFAAQYAAGSSARTYEIARMLIVLRQQNLRLDLLKKFQLSSRQLVAAYEKNLALLAEKPEDYIKHLQEKLKLQKEIEEAESQVRQLRDNLARESGMPAGDFRLNLDQMIRLEDIEKKVQSWVAQKPAPSASLRSKLALLEKTRIEIKLEDEKKGLRLNYFDLGSSLKQDGSPDRLELGVGVSLPLFSGEYRARGFELKSRELKSSQDLEESRLKDELESSQLKKQILYRAEQARSEVNQVLLASINRVQKQTNNQWGAGSMPSLNIQHALAKLSLDQFDLQAPAWEEFLDLALILGELDPQGQILLRGDRS